MTVGTEPPPQQTADAVVQPPPTEQEVFIEQRLSQTQRHVKGVDLAVGLIVLAIGVLAYLLVAALIDHWMVTGGLGIGGRSLLWFGLLVVGGYYAFRAVIPSLIYRINPVFAAQTIEQSKPSLKNSLINFLMMRSHRGDVQPVVYRALERRAASDLSQVELEVAVDRRHVIRLGYVLAGMLAVFCLYLVISPKSPLISAARIIFPWANISAPTRVTIEEIRPGHMTADKAAFHGESVTISAEVEGLDEDEPVVLYFSTGDDRDVDRAVPMTVPKDAYRHQCKLPADSRGLQQGLEYYLKAGDCTTGRFTIEVQTAPAILVESIDYDYPDYTGITDRTVQRQGDIRAIEGTTITLRAAANQEIKRAEIDFDCDSLRGRPMIVAGKEATGHFILELEADDPTLPWHDCYQLRFTDQAGRANRRPIRHEIEVIRDLPPQVQLIDPQQEEVRLAVDGRLEIRVRAEDPDYLLSRVALRMEHGGRELSSRPLLDAPHQGEFQQAYLFDPTRLGLEPGDRVVYWAEAEDNKRPVAGHAQTDKQWIVILDSNSRQPTEPRPDTPRSEPTEPNPTEPNPEQPRQESPSAEDPPVDPSQQPPEDPPAQDDPQPEDSDPSEPQPGDSGEETQPGDSGDPSQDDEANPDETGTEAGGDSGEPSQPIDPETQSGDAMEEILEHMKQQQEEQADEPKQQPGEEAEPGTEETGTEETGTKETGTEETGTGETGTGETDTEEGDTEQTDTEQTDTEQTDAGDPSESESKDCPKCGKTLQSPDATHCNNCGTKQEPTQNSPNAKPGESDTPGESSGDRNGTGEKGPGQQSPEAGTGSPGSNTDSDEGGESSPQPGEGPTGERGGDKVETEQQTGTSAPKPETDGDGEGPGRPSDKQPGGQQGDPKTTSNDDASPGTPQQNPPPGGQAGDRQSDGPSTAGQGEVTHGGSGSSPANANDPPEAVEPGGDDPNLDYARKQTDLALQHIDEQLAKQEPDQDLLDRLGWTRDDLERFGKAWEKMKSEAVREDAQGKAAREDLDDALRSLGLRPAGTRIDRGGIDTDRLDSMREAARHEPPTDWSELLRAYTRGIAGGDR